MNNTSIVVDIRCKDRFTKPFLLGIRSTLRLNLKLKGYLK